MFYRAVGEVGEDGGGYEGEVEASITIWRDGNLKRQYRRGLGGYFVFIFHDDFAFVG